MAVERRSVVDVLNLSGRKETSIRISPRGVEGIALDGGKLVMLEVGRVVVFDVASGRRLHSWRTAQALSDDGGSASQLAGVGGSLLAYVIDARIHVLDLSTGREVVLNTPGATAPVSAAFGRSKLFYAYNEAYSKHPGRVGFIPIPALSRAISAHGRTAR
jgi:hypothetical protein